MSEPTTVRMGALAAYLSLALALSAQGGAAIWWAGTQNTRLTSLEARVTGTATWWHPVRPASGPGGI